MSHLCISAIKYIIIIIVIIIIIIIIIIISSSSSSSSSSSTSSSCGITVIKTTMYAGNKLVERWLEREIVH